MSSPGDATACGQKVSRTPSASELSFMRDMTLKFLRVATDVGVLNSLAETFWRLCEWENERAKMIDAKASSLLGLSTIAAAVVAVGVPVLGEDSPALLWATCASLGLFSTTVILCLVALLGRKYGSFNDYDVFAALDAGREPVGEIPSFEDDDPSRCFLKETILQRWLIYRWHADTNDARYRWLKAAQIVALVSVLSLFVHLGLMLGPLSTPPTPEPLAAQVATGGLNGIEQVQGEAEVQNQEQDNQEDLHNRQQEGEAAGR